MKKMNKHLIYRKNKKNIFTNIFFRSQTGKNLLILCIKKLIANKGLFTTLANTKARRARCFIFNKNIH